MVAFIHTSDWQLGMQGGGLGDAGGRVAAERIATIGRILALAEERGIGLVLAAGDLFEHNHVSQEIVEDVAGILRSHPSVEVHAITGNHDLPGPGCVWNRTALSSIPHLFVHTGRDPVMLFGGGLVLHPFGVHSCSTGKDALAELADLHDLPSVHVALAHGHVTTATFGAHEGDIRLPIDPQHVERSGLDYLALGHWHGTRLMDEHPLQVVVLTHREHEYAGLAGKVVDVEGLRAWRGHDLSDPRPPTVPVTRPSRKSS